MKLSRLGAFAAFTAIFAVGAAALFWGAWSPDVAAVMPDSWTTFPNGMIRRWIHGIAESGKIDIFFFIEWLGGPYVWLELKFAFSLYLAGLGMAYFCRGRGLSLLASYGSGLLLSFCGYWATLFSAGHFGWFLWMRFGVFAFGLADRAVTRRSLLHWLLLGLFVAWASFNQQDLWLLFSVFTAGYVVYACCRERVFPWKGALSALAVFMLVGISNFREVLEGTLKGRQDQIARGENVTDKGASEADRRWEFITNWSMPVEDTAEFFSSRIHGDTSCPFVLSINRAAGIRQYVGALGRPMNAKQGNYRQHSLYVGWVTCLLAIAGVALGFRRRDVLFFAAAAVVFYLLSLGRHFESLYRVIFLLPFGDLIRCPVKWHHLTEFSLVVLAAFGVDALVALLGRFRSVWRLLPEVALGALLVIGVADLVNEDHRFCAPFSVARARQLGYEGQLTIMQRKDFQNPQVAEMVRRGLILSVANYMGHPDVFVVQFLKPYEPYQPKPLTAFPIAFGALSALTATAVLVFAWKRRRDLA